MTRQQMEVNQEIDGRVEDSIAVFAVPFILALGVAVFFVLVELIERLI